MTRVRVLLGTVLLLAFPAWSEAVLTFSMEEVGAEVQVTASGSVNTAGLGVPVETQAPGGLNPSLGTIIVGGPSGLFLDSHLGMSGPAAWGAGGISLPSSGDGGFGLAGREAFLILPQGYMSGGALTGSMTFAGATFSSLGVIPGTYTYIWGSGANADSAVLRIGGATTPAPVPEPSTIALLAAAGSAGLALRRWRRREGRRGERCSRVYGT